MHDLLMARAVYITLCIAGMVGFYFAVRVLEWSLTRGEFIAYGCGFLSALAIYAAADRIERRERAHRDRA